jgi:hypothetical protein
MMTFKEWLLLEDMSAGDDDLTGDLFYPTQAGDYVYATNDPHEHRWLQWKWDQERKQGRKFHNIDQQEFEKRGYSNVHSPLMPEAGSGHWKHRANERKTLEVEKHDDLMQYGCWKNSKTPNPLHGNVMIQVTNPLDRIFKDKTSGKWPEAASSKRWDRFEE